MAKKNVLLAVGGETPEVITETLFGLWYYVRAEEGKGEPEITEGEVHIVTTTVGETNFLFGDPDENPDSRVTLVDTSGRKGILSRFNEAYDCHWRLKDTATNGRAPAPKVVHNGIEILFLTEPSSSATPIKDLDDDKKNTAAANRILELVRDYTKDDGIRLHVSIAGGRRTMGVYLAQAMSWFARPEDTMSHVVVDEKFRQPFPMRTKGQIDPQQWRQFHFILFPFPRMSGLLVAPDYGSVEKKRKKLDTRDYDWKYFDYATLAAYTSFLNELGPEPPSGRSSRLRLFSVKDKPEDYCLILDFADSISIPFELTGTEAAIYLFLLRHANEALEQPSLDINDCFHIADNLAKAFFDLNVPAKLGTISMLSDLKDLWVEHWRIEGDADHVWKRASDLAEHLSRMTKKFKARLNVAGKMDQIWFMPASAGRFYSINVPESHIPLTRSLNRDEERLPKPKIINSQSRKSSSITPRGKQESPASRIETVEDEGSEYKGELNVLLLVGGKTPAVLYETFLGLKQIGIIGGEVHILTTSDGAICFDKLRKKWRDRGGVIWRDRESAKEWRYSTVGPDCDYGISIISDEDVLEKEYNERAANRILEAVRFWKTSPSVRSQNSGVRLHASIAGGRKTMAVYLQQAMSFLAEPEDTLTHVVVDKSFEEEHKSDYIPTEKDTDHIHLIQMKFVRLRPLAGEFIQKMLAAGKTYGDMVRDCDYLVKDFTRGTRAILRPAPGSKEKWSLYAKEIEQELAAMEARLTGLYLFLFRHANLALGQEMLRLGEDPFWEMRECLRSCVVQAGGRRRPNTTGTLASLAMIDESLRGQAWTDPNATELRRELMSRELRNLAGVFGGLPKKSMFRMQSALTAKPESSEQKGKRGADLYWVDIPPSCLDDSLVQQADQPDEMGFIEEDVPSD